MQQLSEITVEELEEAMQSEEKHHLFNVGNLKEDYEAYLNTPENEKYTQFPWQSTRDLKFAYGRFFLWAGYPGHFKSTVTSQIALWLAKEDKVCIANMEQRRFDMLDLMMPQVAGAARSDFSDDFHDWFFDFFKSRIYVYDNEDSIGPERIIALIKLCALKKGIKHIFIDSFMKCGISAESIDKQTRFIAAMCECCRNLGVNVHMIHHVRKGIDQNKHPDMNDIKYAGEITAQADYVIIVHEDRSSEHIINSLKFEKCKYGEKPNYPFTFSVHKPSRQFTDLPNGMPLKYL